MLGCFRYARDSYAGAHTNHYRIIFSNFIKFVVQHISANVLSNSGYRRLSEDEKCRADIPNGRQTRYVILSSQGRNETQLHTVMVPETVKALGFIRYVCGGGGMDTTVVFYG